MVKILRRGSHGREVAAVQKELNRCVTPRLVEDGAYGPKTENAVRHFQKAAGFKGRDVDGEVGPKTMVALFQIFDMKICGTLTPKPNQPANPTPVNPPTTKPPSNDTLPKRFPLLSDQTKANKPDELPRRYQLTGQFGYQDSQRDGQGLQAQLGFTFRSRDYYPNSGANTIYHGLHTETMITPVLGIPLSPSSIYTGQLGVTVQPVTDWFVLWDRLHLLTPSIGIFGQIPLNSGNPLMDDPASHPRLGVNVGVELFHIDLIKDRLAIGVSGQESGYWDFRDRKLFWDPSVLGFLQFGFGAGPRYQPPPGQ